MVKITVRLRGCEEWVRQESKDFGRPSHHICVKNLLVSSMAVETRYRTYPVRPSEARKQPWVALKCLVVYPNPNQCFRPQNPLLEKKTLKK